MNQEHFEIVDKVQREALNLWYTKGCRGTLEMVTGIGKSRCGVLAAALFAKRTGMDYKVLILTPTEPIRDRSWVEEFTRWNEQEVYIHCVKTLCYQSAYKLTGQHYDLVIADEIHNAIPDYDDYLSKNYEYFKFFENNTCDKLLCLSGSIASSKLYILNKIAPVVYRLGTTRAVELGLVSPFTIYNIPIQLTEEERMSYGTLTARLHASAGRGRSNWRVISSRRNVVCSAANKLELVLRIVRLFQPQYGLVFSEYQAYADLITKAVNEEYKGLCLSYHAAVGKKDRKACLDKFCDGRTKIRVLSTAKALNEGVNLPRLRYAVIASGTSKEKDIIQRLGRIIRYEDGKQAILIRLYAKGTRDETWMRKGQRAYNPVYLDSIDQLEMIFAGKQAEVVC